MQKFRIVLGINDRHKKKLNVYVQKVILFIKTVVYRPVPASACPGALSGSTRCTVPVQVVALCTASSSTSYQIQLITLTVLSIVVFVIKLMALSTCFVLM